MQELSDQEFIQICQNAVSMAEAQLLTGLQFTTFKVRATSLGCYNPNKGKRIYSSNDLKIFEILDGKHPTFQPYKLKQLLFKHHIKENKCECCGYNNCIEALDFHHLNPKEKDFSISDRNIKLDWDSIKKELDKCILICSNCHREIHAGVRTIEGSDE